jgi:hypothetical protein
MNAAKAALLQCRRAMQSPTAFVEVLGSGLSLGTGFTLGWGTEPCDLGSTTEDERVPLETCTNAPRYLCVPLIEHVNNHA